MQALSRLRRMLMAVVWPAFLMAGVLEMLVFTLVDPAQLRWFGGSAVELSATAVYSLAFFVFWVVIAAAAAISHRLAESASEVNSRSFSR